MAEDDEHVGGPGRAPSRRRDGAVGRGEQGPGGRFAYIADPDAGTYAQLVEAAESCQVSIIHPGKPRNPAEPGLAELTARAEAFA